MGQSSDFHIQWNPSFETNLETKHGAKREVDLDQGFIWFQIAKAWSKLSKRWCLKRSVFSQDGTAKGSHVFRPPTHLPPETNSCGDWSFPQHSSQQTEGLQSSVPLPGKPRKPRTQTAQWSTHPAPALCSVPAVKSHWWWHVHQLTLLWHMSIKLHCWWHVSINSHCYDTCPSNHTADDTCTSNQIAMTQVHQLTRLMTHVH